MLLNHRACLFLSIVQIWCCVPFLEDAAQPRIATMIRTVGRKSSYLQYGKKQACGAVGVQPAKGVKLRVVQLQCNTAFWSFDVEGKETAQRKEKGDTKGDQRLENMISPTIFFSARVGVPPLPSQPLDAIKIAFYSNDASFFHPENV